MHLKHAYSTEMYVYIYKEFSLDFRGVCLNERKAVSFTSPLERVKFFFTVPEGGYDQNPLK
jgi:hypothetical protein